MDPLLDIKNLSKNFKSQNAVKNLSLQIFPHDCIGLIGPNGSGKTTFLKMITGILKPSEGQIYFEGQKIVQNRNLIGYLPQDPKFFEWMTAREFLEFNCQIFEIDSSLINQSLEGVGLLESGDRKINEFSGGMRQRLGIAQATIHHPKFLILDEPVSALDPSGRHEVLKIMQNLKKETTIIFSTHILADAQEICNRFLIMKKAQIRDDFYLKQMQSDDSLNIKLFKPNDQWISHVKQISAIKNVILKSPTEIQINAQSSDYGWKNQVLQILVDYNLNFSTIKTGQFSLDDYFTQLMED
ncbi:ABC transporter ATP-binding protein [Xylocopilactobacillus apis]|uniref:ABC transporter ATP-binding protein n=1 Tax=Xylocopilactobacillus apis TaxID=2932183 RepID=A0AAU9D1X6_9LACO|nr:ABC transporter ATP-binding protein [Xylocopilactobacillus apis]BDR56285.1 ABC transporter ATP-binding protein [Xylocopilactobacillus apis]